MSLHLSWLNGPGSCLAKGRGCFLQSTALFSEGIIDPKSVNHVINRKTSYMEVLSIRNTDTTLKRNNCFCTLSTFSLVLGCIFIYFRRMVSSQWKQTPYGQKRALIQENYTQQLRCAWCVKRQHSVEHLSVEHPLHPNTRVLSSTHCPKLIWAKIVHGCFPKTLSVWLSFLISRSC